MGGHGEASLGDAVFSAVDRGGIGGDRGDEDQFIATWEKGFSWVSEPVSGGELGEDLGALEIHSEDLVKDFLFGVWEIGAFPWGDACIVDQGIEATESFDNPLDQAGAVFGGGKLGGNGEELLVFGFGDSLARGDGFLGGLAIGGVVDRKVVAFGG